MKLKHVLREVVPPAAWRVMRELRGHRAGSGGHAAREWEYVPEGWAYAQAHPEARGWDVEEIRDVYARKWPRFRALVQGTAPLGVAHESDLVSNEDLVSHNAVMGFGYVLALAARNRQSVSLLDWGGGIGHYYLISQALFPDLAVDYHCKDARALAEYGAEVLPEGHFYHDESCLAGSYDLVMASTSLHYTENWQPLVRALAQSARSYLYVTGLPTVRAAASFVFVQRPYAYGYNTEYLGWCLNRDEFLSCAALADVTLVREFVVGLKPPVHNAPEQVVYRGFLFNTGQRRAA